jgi:hypothetical protein
MDFETIKVLCLAACGFRGSTGNPAADHDWLLERSCHAFTTPTYAAEGWAVRGGAAGTTYFFFVPEGQGGFLGKAL